MSTYNAMKIERSLREVEVLALELEPPLVVDVSTTVADTIRKMQTKGHGCALVTSGNRLTGIFTERDVFLAVVDNEAALSRRISRQMTPDPVCITAKAPVCQAVLLMHQGGYRQTPIVDGSGQVTGCVRHKDIAEYLVNHFAAHVLNLPPDPEQIARTPEGA
jgi:CBS domain-containing protein